MFDKGATNTRWGKSILFNLQCWGNRISTCKKKKKKKLDLYFTPYTKLTQNGLKT